MDWIYGLFGHYDAATKANPLLATLVLPLVGGIMFYLKDLPKKFWDLVVRYTTVTMRLNNAGWDGNADAYNMFDKWFMMSGYAKFSRSFFMFRQYKEDMFSDETVFKPYRLGIGKGVHVFWYKRKFFWFDKGSLESGGSEKQKEEITIRTFGWNQSSFLQLVDLFNEKRGASDEVFIHKYGGDKSWEQVGKVPMRDIETFCMNADLKADILGRIEEFSNRREWYRKKGLTYKISFLFYGPPGTGKTTLSKLLSARFKKDLYLLDLSQHSNASLMEALATIKPGSIVLIEDVDQSGSAVKDRKKKKELVEAVADLSFLTMSGVLNAFDGVIGLDNLIVIMTTNHPEDLDEAIKRAGRVDKDYLIGELTSKEIEPYMALMYDLTDEEVRRFILSCHSEEWLLPGCEVELAFKENPEDPDAFLTELCRRSNAKRLKLVA
ncbi:hypothetical protein [Burkholderia phage FLC6]|nr:hypothetical protein [Burkholderia phage FLC6]BDD79300.1 hypothetical protein [Burkholderia phage FLC8]